MNGLLKSALVVLLLLLVTTAVVRGGEMVVYQPFLPDPPDTMAHAQRVGELKRGIDTMDVMPDGIPFANLSDCSILFEGPDSNPYRIQVWLMHLSGILGMQERLCGYSTALRDKVTIRGSKQTVTCRTNPSPPVPPSITINYTFVDYCPPQ